MCGIAGIIGQVAQPRETMLKMLALLVHRGPDAQGLWVGDGFAFGIQRLSIVDLVSGNQPLWNDSGMGIVCNGELYNFAAQRKRLEEKGISFRTHSDTEVMLQLYVEQGINAVHHWEGMFGLCLYDPLEHKVYLIRDRLGIKPLYYTQVSGVFFFASEIKSLLAVQDPFPTENLQSLWHYLTLRYVPGPETIWKGIHKVPPGHYLTYDLQTKTFDLTPYWNLVFCAIKRKNVRADQEEKAFATLFLNSVEKHLLSADVPVGVLLSGGIDSSCIAAAALELGYKNLHTFSVGFAEDGKESELAYAREVAVHLGSTHHEIEITQLQFLDFLEDFTWYTDEPLADLASIPLYYVVKLASQHVKVVLSGEGADEIFLGYDADRLAKNLFYRRLIRPLLHPLFWAEPLLQKCFPKRWLSRLQNLSRTKDSLFFRDNALYMTHIFSEEEKMDLCPFVQQASTKKYLQGLYDACSSSQPLEQLQQVYCQDWLVEDLLRKADRMSMASSVELRVPFLDHRLVEWAAQLPLSWKVGSFSSGFTTKRILRSFAQKRLPSRIITRPKQGFPVPAYRWIQESLFPLAQEALEELAPWLRREALLSLLNQLSQGNPDAPGKVWNLVVLWKWRKRWQVE